MADLNYRTSFMSALELKFCEELLNEMREERYDNISYLFKAPFKTWVPYEAGSIRMDLEILGQKLEDHQYEKAQQFHDDVKLMFRISRPYFGSDLVFFQDRKQFENFFDEKWI
ncbi:MAG: hypothetical protein M1834_007589 [Cirrosporium novae-zelandiae]|nr:MAG: hypothetical protein M1834_007589 [Cirrosporium novae-zelandiae]